VSTNTSLDDEYGPDDLARPRDVTATSKPPNTSPALKRSGPEKPVKLESQESRCTRNPVLLGDLKAGGRIFQRGVLLNV